MFHRCGGAVGYWRVFKVLGGMEVGGKSQASRVFKVHLESGLYVVCDHVSCSYCVRQEELRVITAGVVPLKRIKTLECGSSPDGHTLVRADARCMSCACTDIFHESLHTNHICIENTSPGWASKRPLPLCPDLLSLVEIFDSRQRPCHGWVSNPCIFRGAPVLPPLAAYPPHGPT
jgi:hypothetical protein